MVQGYREIRQPQSLAILKPLACTHGMGHLLKRQLLWSLQMEQQLRLSIQRSGGGDLTIVFSDGYYAYDTTPADTITLTAGSDTSPQINYVYILQSTKALTVSTTSFPATECARVATVLCQSAASLQTDGAYKHHQWTDDVKESNEQGHISDMTFWIREQPATWIDGVVQTYTITTNAGSADNVILTTTSGNVLQLHDNDFPAFSGTPDIYVINDSVTPYTKVTDLNALLTDSTGASMSGRYFSLVIWGAVNQEAGDCKLYCNLPSGSYGNASNLTSDSSKFANYEIPSDFRGVGFLISQWNLRHQASSNGTWTSIGELDLRGIFPSISAGGSNSFPTEFSDNTFRIFDESDSTKEIAFQASGITTATTRTITMADADVSLVSNTGTFAAAAGGTQITTLGTIATGTWNGTDIAVADGGTGRGTATEYGVLCGGTTATAAHQSIASVGTSGQVLTSNGAGALPTFQAVSGGDVTAAANITDNTIVRGDGGAKGVQDSGISVSDVDAITGVTSLDVDNIRIDGSTISYAGTAGVVLASDGSITLPTQPWVIATGAGATNATGNGVQYNQVLGTEVKDVGGNFASSTFTAPITGCYQQCYFVYYEGLTSSHTYCRGRIVTSNRTYEDYLVLLTNQTAFQGNRVVHATDMDAADTAVCNVVVFGGTQVVDIDEAMYSCYLLG
jgi:hypothetical protein